MTTYTITEEEFNQLENVRCQLRLFGDLLDQLGGRSSPFDMTDLGVFFSTQGYAMGAVLLAMVERFDEARDCGMSMSHVNWVHLIRILRGSTDLPHDAKAEIDRAMETSILRNPDYADVRREWHAALGSVRASQQLDVQRGGAVPPKGRKRDRLAAAVAGPA